MLALVTQSLPAKMEIGGFKNVPALMSENGSNSNAGGVWSWGMSNVLKVSHEEAIRGLH
jgi:hypothetical protein